MSLASPTQDYHRSPTPTPIPAWCRGVLPVLIIKPKWGRRILDGKKVLEIRRGNHKKHIGKRIGLCFSGTSAIQGYVDFVGTVGPLDLPMWGARRSEHCVPDEKLPYGKHTWGWAFANPERLSEPIRFERNAAVIFQSVRL